jgi:hypothetical protein
LQAGSPVILMMITIQIPLADFQKLPFPINRPFDLFKLFFSSASPAFELAHKLFIETISELDEKTRKMILVQLKLKLQIEHEFDKLEVTREWTKMICENIQE